MCRILHCADSPSLTRNGYFCQGYSVDKESSTIAAKQHTTENCCSVKSIVAMVKNESQTIKYRHPFAAVTSSLWSKYDAHKYVKEVEVLERYLDDAGRLHSKRLLTMRGSLPAIFQPFVPGDAISAAVNVL
uniref:PRELI/MSF1 domain-containing protein n=1 Tax=Guillardia theta TaxID=55529 RepID=A0A7S4PQ21_GUITH|mmetsp:Transcript_9113/g.30388  ORF Transcript_9113/g.30388 Transcript_9113/m.30388 type:complete len:131 (+) Transcript_9113:151-543(+)